MNSPFTAREVLGTGFYSIGSAAWQPSSPTHKCNWAEESCLPAPRWLFHGLVLAPVPREVEARPLPEQSRNSSHYTLLGLTFNNENKSKQTKKKRDLTVDRKEVFLKAGDDLPTDLRDTAVPTLKF